MLHNARARHSYLYVLSLRSSPAPAPVARKPAKGEILPLLSNHGSQSPKTRLDDFVIYLVCSSSDSILLV
jgi:hypothetical protein